MVMDGELETEFQRLCGGEESVSTLQVCSQLEKAVKEMRVRVMAEVAMHMRTCNPNRELIQEVTRDSANSVLGLVQRLRLRSKKGAVVAMWAEVILDVLSVIQGVLL